MNKIRGGYPVEQLIGVADLPAYNPTTKTQRILSTPGRPSGPLLEEKETTVESIQSHTAEDQHMRQLSKYNQPSLVKQRVPSTPDRPSGPLLEERNITNRIIMVNDKQGGHKQKRASVTNEEDDTPEDQRVVINDDFYNKTVFERLGPKRIQFTSPASTTRYSKPLFSEQQAWRGDCTPTQEEYTRKVSSSSQFGNQIPVKIHPTNQSRTTYSEIVKTHASRVVNKPSIKSTSDMSKTSPD